MNATLTNCTIDKPA
jgi:hypothetical protein